MTLSESGEWWLHVRGALSLLVQGRSCWVVHGVSRSDRKLEFIMKMLHMACRLFFSFCTLHFLLRNSKDP